MKKIMSSTMCISRNTLLRTSTTRQRRLTSSSTSVSSWILPSSRLFQRLHSSRNHSDAKESRSTTTPPSPPSFSFLPTPKAEFSVLPMGRFASLLSSSSHDQSHSLRATTRRGRSVIQRVGSTYGGTHSLRWFDRPQTVLVICKKGDAKGRSGSATVKVVQQIKQHYPHLNILVEEEVYQDLRDQNLNVILLEPDNLPQLAHVVDFIVSIGGDGTLLRTSSLFDDTAVPPIIGINSGTVGFMMPVDLDAFPQVLDDVLENRSSMLLRMRLQCEVFDEHGDLVKAVTQDGHDERAHVHAMNEITLHRGASPHLIYLDARVDGAYLTEVVADGLLVSTPTGSTAYSLSSGGPIVHPSVQSLGLTAIAPRSLSFRTVLLPSDVAVQLNLSSRSRTSALLSLDGLAPRLLEPTQSLRIKMSPYPVPCIHSSPLSRLADKGKEEHDPWVEDMRRMLRFNSPFRESNSEGR